MFLNNLMNARNLTRAELSASSHIPESTLRDILNGKAQLDRCAAVTLYNLAYALDVSVEDILEDYWEELELERAAHTHIPVHDNHALMNFYVLADSTLGFAPPAIWRSSTESTRTSGSNASMTMSSTAVRCSWLASWITCAARMVSGR